MGGWVSCLSSSPGAQPGLRLGNRPLQMGRDASQAPVLGLQAAVTLAWTPAAALGLFSLAPATSRGHTGAALLAEEPASRSAAPTTSFLHPRAAATRRKAPEGRLGKGPDFCPDLSHHL